MCCDVANCLKNFALNADYFDGFDHHSKDSPSLRRLTTARLLWRIW